MNLDEKKAIANDAEKYCVHPIVMDAVKEFAENMRMELRFPFSYGLSKIANAVAQVAIAYERGIDPDDLRLSKDEKYESIMEHAQIVTEMGGEVLGVILDDTSDPHLGAPER